MRTITIEICNCSECNCASTCKSIKNDTTIPDDCPIWAGVKKAKEELAERIQEVANDSKP